MAEHAAEASAAVAPAEGRAEIVIVAAGTAETSAARGEAREGVAMVVVLVIAVVVMPAEPVMRVH
ncbi:MAG TPA: hypothetical protein VHE32_01360 [Rhodanobacteraceae bacterium]|jgi:hypothetical protein|nr:hypothetical protein [Rhodanobacteraceae bacterium]